jgi:ketosteroid isomerase-like protein
MSQEDVMVVEAAYEALTRSGLDAFADYWADDIEWRTMRSRWDGKEAGRAYLHAVNEGVVLYLRYGGCSKRSGVAVPPEYFAIVMQIRDGKIVQGVEYATRGEA